MCHFMTRLGDDIPSRLTQSDPRRRTLEFSDGYAVQGDRFILALLVQTQCTASEPVAIFAINQDSWHSPAQEGETN